MLVLVELEKNVQKIYGEIQAMVKNLTSAQRYLLENQKLLKEMSPQKRGTFYRDVRKKAFAALNDLTFLAKVLPEKQQAQIFNKENVGPLFDSLFSIKGLFDEKDVEKRRRRLLQMFNLLFSQYICNMSYVLSLAKKERQILSAAQSFAADMQALYLASAQEK